MASAAVVAEVQADRRGDPDKLERLIRETQDLVGLWTGLLNQLLVMRRHDGAQ